MTDKELITWLEKKETQEWIRYKSYYFASNDEDAKDLKSDALERIWLYRATFTGEATDKRLKSWVFFVLKYAWFHISHQKKKDILLYRGTFNKSYNREQELNFETNTINNLSTESTVLRSLQAETEINKVIHQIDKNLSKKHSKVFIMASDGYEQTEIAEKMNLSKSYINNLQTQTNAFMRGDKIKERIIKRKVTTKIPIIAWREDEDRNILEEREFPTPSDAASKLDIKSKSAVFRALENEGYTAEGWHFKRKNT